MKLDVWHTFATDMKDWLGWLRSMGWGGVVGRGEAFAHFAVLLCKTFYVDCSWQK